MKKYFSYFKILFIAMGILFVVMVVITAANNTEEYTRRNDEAPEQRVYDYAGVLSKSEEEKLEELIAKRENQIGCDIVLVTIDESLYEKYGITVDTDENWEECMIQYAEDFYLDNNFGFDEPGIDGDGALLLHNWYPGEKGSHLTHGGKVWDHYDDYMIADVLDEIYYKAQNSPYEAYKYYVEDMYREMSGKNGITINPLIGLIGAVASCGIFVSTHIKPKEGKKTTTESTYVENGSIKYNVKRDELVNKYVTSRVIPQSSGGGGGSRGGRRSSGGRRMGGGSRRG